MRVSTGGDVSYAPSIEQPVMVSRRGRGRDHSRGLDLEDKAYLEMIVVPMVVDRLLMIRDQAM